MAEIKYDSDFFTNGESIQDTEEVGKKKIRLKDIPVTGNVVIPEKKIDPTALTWEGDAPDLSALETQLEFNRIGVVMDPNVKKEILSEGESGATTYYAKFGVYASGNVTYGGKTYRATSSDIVKVKLQIGKLKNPDFTEAVIQPFLTDAAAAYIDAATKIPMYQFGVESFEVPASGKADIEVALITLK